MSTNSTIAIEYPSGVVDAIYCHFDGYPIDGDATWGVGWLLYQHYQDEQKIKALIRLGSLRELKRDLGCKHPGQLPDDPDERKIYEREFGHMVTAYHRDVERPWKENKWRRYRSRAAYRAHENLEWNYLYNLTEGQWYIARGWYEEEMSLLVPLTTLVLFRYVLAWGRSTNDYDYYDAALYGPRVGNFSREAA